MDLQSKSTKQPPRQPLQTLPALPINKRPAPVATICSPLDSITTLKSLDPLSPPVTPIRPRNKRSPLSAESIGLGSLEEEVLEAQSKSPPEVEEGVACSEPLWEATTPRLYTNRYKIQDTTSSQHAEYGRGVWSVVYRAHEISTSLSALPTPPNSPVNSPPAKPTPAVLAVKSPSRRDAHKILLHEARMLTYLHAFSASSRYLVPFHGYDVFTHSVVLDPLPLNLDRHAKVVATSSTRTNLCCQAAFDPVVGLAEWSMLATQLVAGLYFLHAHDCIHGDIKPANILLRQDVSGVLEPIYCDFSSSRHNRDPTPAEITALTPDYSAPELLSSLTQPDIPTLPSFKADVYALGVTLLFVALGESPYACARLDMMKLGMAKEGRPLDFARAGDQAARVRKGSCVERSLLGAVRKEEQRWDAAGWVDEVKKVLRDEPGQDL